MATPAFIWICVAAISLALLLSLLIGSDSATGQRAKVKNSPTRMPPLSMGSEREEFFIPGDPVNGQMDDNDD